jgi:Ran GTPase-activating protein (RanGAP) involved in mRNA processing and transport
MVETTLYQTFMRLGGFGMIGDAGAKFLAQMQQIQSLVSLDLSGNTIGCAGLQAMMNTIYFSTTLTSLELSGNPLGDKGATILGNALKLNRSLTHLGLHCCDINIVGLGVLV